MSAYYNENDKNAAAWLRQLIKHGLIADGEVDERSIIDVQASDIAGFRQHHFFAGIGGWSYALRLANWPDSKPVCTASLPCQPFSAAGKGLGKEDERHLLPHFVELVRKCGFNTIFGEQVEASIKHGWLDNLRSAMDGEGYAIGVCVLGAHSVGAPHIRQRLYWAARRSDNKGLGNADSERLQGWDGTADKNQLPAWAASVVNEWKNPDWVYCRDEKYRPVKPGIKPLADGISRRMVRSGDNSEPINLGSQEARIMRIKGYGNAIVPQVAAELIKAFMMQV